ncbi:ATP-binding protein [Thalassotalea litorea]|uniref:ATP-binding protein n=1 Tax=Thalassotalea litorea TaxID=2020715 RepID=UPI0037358C48
MEIYTRPIKKLVEEALIDTPVVSILGPRQVGKSTLAKIVAPDREYVTLDDQNLLHLALEDSMGFVQSLPRFVIIDEVQRAPKLMLAIKKSVDEDRTPGRFLLTGSANLLLMEQIQDSLAGRHEPIYLFPLTNHEISNTPASKSFVAALLSGSIKPKTNAYSDTLEKLKVAVCRGGYPIPLTRTERRAKRWFSVYLEDIINRDVKAVDDIRNPDALLKMFKLCAVRSATLLEMNSLAKDVQISVETAKSYLSTLEKLFLIRVLPAWSTNLGKRLIKSPKIHLIDSGMLSALCGLTSEDWLTKPKLFGHLIESYTVQQILTQIEWIDDDVESYHFRDQKKREVDLVLEKAGLVWGVEMKRSTSISEEDYKGLRALADIAGKNWKGGVIFYSGNHIIPTPIENTFAVPYSALWDGVR